MWMVKQKIENKRFFSKKDLPKLRKFERTCDQERSCETVLTSRGPRRRCPAQYFRPGWALRRNFGSPRLRCSSRSSRISWQCPPTFAGWFGSPCRRSGSLPAMHSPGAKTAKLFRPSHTKWAKFRQKKGLGKFHRMVCWLKCRHSINVHKAFVIQILLLCLIS